MKQVRTQFEYHDSTIVEFLWVDDKQLLLRIQLDPHWDEGNRFVVSLRFDAIRNREQIELQLNAINDKRTHDRFFAEIVGLRKELSHLYLVDTGEGPIQIDAPSMLEF